MKNIVLIGMMGSGKSTIGQLLSSALEMPFMDSDALIEEKEHCKISDIFSQEGEAFFRNLEKKVIAEISTFDNCIVSTGGGVVLDEANTINLKKGGKIFLLSGDRKTLFDRLINNAEDRPLLNEGELEEKIDQLLEAREDLYNAAADYIIEIDNKSPETIVGEIVDIYCKIG